ncbi:MAG TPA: hemolysin family protein [Candidatus Binataceae bacterium]
MIPIEVALVVAVCVLTQAFFAASEISLVSADELKVNAESATGSKDSKLLADLLARRDRLLALVLTSTNLVTVTAAAVLTAAMHRHWPQGEFLAPFILAPLTLVFGESIPKLLVLKNPLAFARIAARPLKVLASLLAPLLFVETSISRGLRRLIGVPPDIQSVFLSRDDLALLIHRGGEAKAIPDQDAILPVERQLIGRIFRFRDSEARKAMVPLVRVEAVPQEAPLSAAIEAVRREGFSRLPVFDARITNIVGVVHVFDLLDAPDLTHPVREIMRQVSYFPESTPLDEILVALQAIGQNLAVVVDEYGGASGILTVEDLLEEIVGEIEDEYDESEDLARIVNANTLVLAARAPIASLNERFDLRLPEGDEYTTIGGLVVERLGHIPKPGEQLKVGDVTISVTRSDSRAVREVTVSSEHSLIRSRQRKT